MTWRAVSRSAVRVGPTSAIVAMAGGLVVTASFIYVYLLATTWYTVSSSTALDSHIILYTETQTTRTQPCSAGHDFLFIASLTRFDHARAIVVPQPTTSMQPTHVHLFTFGSREPDHPSCSTTMSCPYQNTSHLISVGKWVGKRARKSPSFSHSLPASPVNTFPASQYRSVADRAIVLPPTHPLTHHFDSFPWLMV